MAMTQNSLEELRQIAELVLTDPPAAADRIDAVADRLHEQANALRASVRPEVPYRVPSGMNDRIKMRVMGPDGKIRQEIDTN
jgi:hypothetical protein